INDVPIEASFPQLAALAGKSGLPAPVLHRALNAHFRLGRPENAAAVAAFAARADAPERLRREALSMLADWAKPSGRDRVMGLWRPLPPRPAEVAVAALRKSLAGAFTGPERVRQEAARVAGQLGIKEAGPTLLALAADKGRAADTRVESLLALDAG